MLEKLKNKIEKYVEEIQENPDDDHLFYEKAELLQRPRKYRIKDFNNAITALTNEELEMYKNKENRGKIIEQKEIEKYEIARNLLNKAIEIRRKNNKITSPVDTNILSASPFYLGGSRALKQEAKKRGFIKLEKNGFRRLTYQNDLGVLLTFNDAKTLFALFALWEEQHYAEWTKFTIYQLLDKMNTEKGGNQYKIALTSLEKLRNTSIVLQEAYDVKTGKRFITERFNLIIADRFTEEYDANKRIKSRIYEIQFSPYVRESVKNGYYSLISLALWDEIESESAKALYSMLTGVMTMEGNEAYFKEGEILQLPLDVVYEHLKLDNPRPSRNKTVVEAGCEELEEIEVIDNFYFIGRGRTAEFLVIKPSSWLMNIFEKTRNERKERIEQIKHIETIETESPLNGPRLDDFYQ